MASIPFNKTVGYPILRNGPLNHITVPGFIGFHFKPTIGAAEPSLSNYQTKAANAYYQYVTQGFTTLNSLEAPDMYFTAVASASLMTAMINFKRAYGVMRYYLQQNRYFSRNIVSALGFNFDDLEKNLANARAEYNLRAASINQQIAVPKNFALADRWEYVHSFIFCDSTDPTQATMYGYVPDSFLLYNPTLASTGTCLTYVDWTSGAGATVAGYFSFVDRLIAALTDEDTRDTFAAIRRVYDDSSLKKVSLLGEDFSSPIAHTDMAAMQFHNMVTACTSNGACAFTSGGGYLPAKYATDGKSKGYVAAYQTDKGIIATQPYVYSNMVEDPANKSRSSIIEDFCGGSVIIDLYNALGTPADILDSTANIQAVTSELDLGSDDAKYFVVCRTENIYNIVATYYVGDTLFSSTIYQGITNVRSDGSVIAPIGDSFPSIALRENTLSRMDSHPLLYTYSGDLPSTASFICGELDKYTTMSVDNLADLHNRCLYQLTLLPSNTKSVTK